MIGQIATTLGEIGLNIADMTNVSRGEIAYNLIDVENKVNEAAIEAVSLKNAVTSKNMKVLLHVLLLLTVLHLY